MREMDLYEGYSDITDIEWIKKNCSEILDYYDTNQRGYLFRGSDMVGDSIVLMTPEQTPRKAAYAKMNIHTELINSGAFGKLPKREIIMSSSMRYAQGYGNVSVCLPVNGSIIGDTDVSDIYDAFYGLPCYPSTLSRYYDCIRDLISAAYVIYNSNMGTELEVGDLHSVEDLKIAIARISDYTFTEEDLDRRVLNNSLMDYEVKEEVLKTHSIKPLIKPFKKNGLKATSISNMDIQTNIEYWTDSPTVLIPVDMYLKFVDDGVFKN